MKDALIFGLVGLAVMVLGILLNKREKRLFKDPVETTAKVTTYYEYYNETPDNISGRQRMYTMAVEYHLADGTLIQASEQKGSNTKKYPEGQLIQIQYSREKPDLFNVKGDHSRKIIMVGMIVVGVLMVVCGGYMFFTI